MTAKKDKICIFSAQYFPNVGGVERYTYNLARKLLEKGIDVTIVTSNNHQVADYENTEGIKIYRLPCFNLMSGRFPVVKFNKKCRNMLQKIGREKYSLVITNTRFYLHSLVGVVFGKKHGKNSILIEHGTSHLSVHNPAMDFMEQAFEHSLTAVVKLFCKKFYGVSEACNQWLKHFHIQAMSTLYNSIDVDEIQTILDADRNDFRKQNGIPENSRLIAFTGRILPEKGIQELLQAFKTIKEKYPDCCLAVAGDGPLLNELKAQQQEGVFFLGQIPFEKVVALLHSSSIFCLPSVSEGMPTSVLEAVACRNFVITTARGGAKEIILDDSYGMIMENNSVDYIIQSLEKVLNDEAYRKAAVEKSYHRLTDQFTWDKVADKVIQIMRQS